MPAVPREARQKWCFSFSVRNIPGENRWIGRPARPPVIVKGLGLPGDQVQRQSLGLFIGLHHSVPGYVGTEIPQEATRKLADSERSVDGSGNRDNVTCKDQNQLQRQVWKHYCLYFFFPFSINYLGCSITTPHLYYWAFLSPWEHDITFILSNSWREKKNPLSSLHLCLCS